MAYASLLDRLGLHRRELRAWAYYDVANSAWMTTILQLFSPAFFVPYAARHLPPDVARSRFAFGTSLMVVVIGLVGPWLGALADYQGRKKAFMGGFLALGAALTAALYFVREGQWVLALLVFGVANVGDHVHPRVLQRAPAVDRRARRGGPRLDRRLRARVPRRRGSLRAQRLDDRQPGDVRARRPVRRPSGSPA